MLRKIVLAVLAAMVAYLVMVVVGAVLVATTVAWVVAAGSLLKEFAGFVAVLVFLYYAFVGSLPLPRV